MNLLGDFTELFMLQAKRINESKGFIGRDFERKKLNEIAAIPEASIIIVYGRRRKTTPCPDQPHI